MGALIGLMVQLLMMVVSLMVMLVVLAVRISVMMVVAVAGMFSERNR
jgi:hypothetical protein